MTDREAYLLNALPEELHRRGLCSCLADSESYACPLAVEQKIRAAIRDVLSEADVDAAPSAETPKETPK